VFLQRKLLREELERLGSKHNWEHITNQIVRGTCAPMRDSMDD
jgi:hypothetical protein